MAASKRRLKDDYDSETVSSRAKKQKIGRRGRAQQANDKDSQPVAGLFQKLPGEIRNRIYELALTDKDKPIPVRFAGLRLAEEYYAQFYPDKQALRFREPALLMTCKGIRAEALPLYYSSNTFHIAVTTANFNGLYEWVMDIQKRCGPQPLGSIELYLRSGRWQDLCSCLPLAKLFRDADFNLTNKFSTSKYHIRGKQVVVPVLALGSIFPTIAVALGEVASFGREAKALGHSDTWLRTRFTRWFHEVANCDCHGVRVTRRKRLSDTIALYSRYGIDRRIRRYCADLPETPEDAKHIAEIKIEREKLRPKFTKMATPKKLKEKDTTSDAADTIGEVEQERFDDEDEFA